MHIIMGNKIKLGNDRIEPLAKTPSMRSGSPVRNSPSCTLEPDLLPPTSQAFFDNILRLNLLDADLAKEFVKALAGHLSEFASAESLGEALVQAGLLTQYQLDRVMSGKTYGLVLGHYRVLDRLGAGGMGIVYLGEHISMQRRVAIKVLPVDDDCPPMLLERFHSEARALAKLHHPNIVMAYDAGQVAPALGFPLLEYLIMELVGGCDLEQHVQINGPVGVGKACNWICQAACGLQAAHDRKLIHRDIKPSNVLLTKDEQVKLVDFGLVRQLSLRLTDPKMILGTIDFMPPEQGLDPTSVGTHSDIYALGATLFWLLTGATPHAPAPSLMVALQQMQRRPARRLREFRQEAPRELETVLIRLLEKDPLRRPPTAMSVRKYLEPFASQ
jgi:serine/threonine protein kinase